DQMSQSLKLRRRIADNSWEALGHLTRLCDICGGDFDQLPVRFFILRKWNADDTGSKHRNYTNDRGPPQGAQR
ncbi:MAG: hypothetical protein ACR2QW_03270, partial [bacterium]